MSEKFMNPNDGILEKALQSEDRNYLIPQVIEMFEVDGCWRGMIHDTQEGLLPIGYFGVAHNFRGKSAHIIIISHDTRVSWNIAIEFAVAIAAGNYSYERIDLTPLNNFARSLKSNKKGPK